MTLSVRSLLLSVAASAALAACSGDSGTGVPLSAVGHKAGGDNQIANPGNALPLPVRVQVADSDGVPLSGVSVHFAVATGGGHATPATATTNDSGIAATTWILGGTTSTQTLNATVGNQAPLVFTASSIPSSGAGFQITLANIGPPFSQGVKDAFDSAITFWQSAITGDISDFAAHDIPRNSCNNAEDLGPFNVDDVIILAQFDSIDGPGQILGQASPCYIRNSNFLTISGTMRFDTADIGGLISSGRLKFVIRHEMGHVLGFGTLWGPSLVNCLQNPSASGSPQDTYFSCSAANAAFTAIGGNSYTGGQKVPVENCGSPSLPGCGPGTFNSHWRELVFFQELMTGYLDNGQNPVSRLTLGAMEDLGYTVNYAASQAYTPTTPFHAPSAGRAAQPLINLNGDVPDRPIYVVDQGGRITAIARHR